MAKCGVCGEEIKHKGGRPAKYCSSRCRLIGHRDETKRIETKLNDLNETKPPSKNTAENFLEKVSPHVWGTENVELQETCQRLVNEGKLDACHIDLADWGFVDPNPGAESYFFPKKFKTQGVAQIKESKEGRR